MRSRNPEEDFLKISELGLQYFRRYDLWKLGLFAGSSIHRGIFAINFFYEGSESKIFRAQSRTLEEHRHKISDLGSQYFGRYGLWKLGIFQALEFHLKEVIVGKSS